MSHTRRSSAEIEASAEDHEEVEAATSKLLSFVDDYRYLESLAGERPITTFPPQVRNPSGPIERFAEYCAQEERERLNLGTHQPIHSLRSVLEESGLHVFFDKLEFSLAGLYPFVPDFGYCILVNSLHPRDRRRWTIAHEYGHFLADRDRPGIDYLKPMQRKPESERFADTFAAAFLLIPRGSWDEIKASRLPVSVLQRDTGKAPGRDLDSSDLYPKRYKMLAILAFNTENLSEGELARLLRCSRIRAREMVEQCSIAPDDVDGTSSRVPLELTQSLLSAIAK